VLACQVAELGVGLGLGGRDDPQVQERSRAAAGGEPAEARRLERREQGFLGKATAAHHALVTGGDRGRVTEDDVERADGAHRRRVRGLGQLIRGDQLGDPLQVGPGDHGEAVRLQHPAKFREGAAERARLGANARAFTIETYNLPTVCLPRQIEWVAELASRRRHHGVLSL
jgi:hypothetical protein